MMMEQSLFLGRIENPIQLQSCLGKKQCIPPAFYHHFGQKQMLESQAHDGIPELDIFNLVWERLVWTSLPLQP